MPSLTGAVRLHNTVAEGASATSATVSAASVQPEPRVELMRCLIRSATVVLARMRSFCVTGMAQL